MKVAVVVWLLVLGTGCEHGLWLAGDAGEGSPDARDEAGDAPDEGDDGRDADDADAPPPPASPPWCPAEATSRPCRPALLRQAAGDGRVAAAGFLDDGVALLVDSSAATTGPTAGSQVALLRLRLDGRDERHDVWARGTEVGAGWTGTEFGVVVPATASDDGIYLRVGPDGDATSVPVGRRLCEELAWTGDTYRCVVTTTADVTWETLSLEGIPADRHQYDDCWVRSSAWGAEGPGILCSDAGDWEFVRLAADGPPAIPRTRIGGAFSVGDSLLVSHGRGFLALFLRGGYPSGDAELVVAMGINPDGSVPHRPVIVDTIRARSHMPSWGPVQFAASAAGDDTVVAYRHLEPTAIEGDPSLARLYFRAITDDGDLGERSELPPTTDDDFMREWVVVARSGTGLVVARSHSRSTGGPLGLDVWIGCCE
ncbi:MAG: hypothetical protein HY905_21880 [Deltaproteobacteria bacterium]|nr:hypothetical protein [Deltaproteobacteria bacterium]